MVRKGVILTGGYSDYYCKGHCILCILLVSFLLFYRFGCLLYFSQEQVYIGTSHRLLAVNLQYKVRLIYCMVLLHCICGGFEAIVMFGGYSDSFVFLLIHSLYTTAKPVQTRSLTNFLKSTVMQATGLKVKISRSNWHFPRSCQFY